jgi:hypothetical protein
MRECPKVHSPDSPTHPTAGTYLYDAVRFTIEPPLLAFQYCHNSRCRKAAGSAHAVNLFVSVTSFAWTVGAERRLGGLEGRRLRSDQPASNANNQLVQEPRLFRSVLKPHRRSR